MYQWIAGAAAVSAVVGFVGGAASMSSYMQSHQPHGGEDARPAAGPGVTDGLPGVDPVVRTVGKPVGDGACQVARFGGYNTAPGVKQVSTVGTVAVNAVNGVSGGRQCTVRDA